MAFESGGFKMELRERYEYLNNLLETAKAEYAGNPQFSTELEIVSLTEECRQLLSKIDDHGKDAQFSPINLQKCQ
jgi:hypothetical protein